MSYKAKPRFTKPTKIIVSDERRDLTPIYRAFIEKSATRLIALRNAVAALLMIKGHLSELPEAERVAI